MAAATGLAVLFLASPGQAALRQEIRAAGTLSVLGRCRILTDDAGRQFALVGALGSFTTGDRIVVTGTVGEPSGCIEGTTLQVEKVRPDLPRRAARQTSLAATQSAARREPAAVLPLLTGPAGSG